MAQGEGATTQQVVVPGKGGFSPQASVAELLEFQFTGLLVVFFVLGALTLICSVMARIFACFPALHSGMPNPSPVSPAASTPPVPASSGSIHPGLADEKLLALLAVSAQEVLGQQVALVRFRPMDSRDWIWPVQGRVGLHGTHQR